MCMSPEQERQKEEARREAIKNTYNVCADGQKKAAREYGEFGNEINNE